MRMRKGQTAMEYLMTYGWAILIIMVVLAVLFYLGVLNPPMPEQCTFEAGLTCATYKLYAKTGQLEIDLGQGTGKTIRVMGVYCISNATTGFTPDDIGQSVLYDDYDGISSDSNVTIASGSHAFVASNVTQTGKEGRNHIWCRDADGNTLSSDTAGIGAQYNGKIFINYTEVDSGVSRVRVAQLTKKFEA